MAHHATFRIFILRLLLVACIIILATAPQELGPTDKAKMWTYVGYTIAIFLHHSASVFVISWQPAVLDLIMVTTEVAISFALVKPWSMQAEWYATPRQLCMLMAVWVQLVTLGLLLVVRVGTMIVSLRERVLQSLLEPYDFFKHTRDNRSHVRIFVLAGFDIWKFTFRNEPRTIIALRGLFGLLFMAMIIAYVLWHLILEPFQETGRMPLNTYTSGAFPNDLKLEPQMQWHLVAYIDALFFYQLDVDTAISNIRDSITVEPMWFDSSLDYPCTLSEMTYFPTDFGDYDQYVDSAFYGTTMQLEINCPHRLSQEQQDAAVWQDNYPTANLWPDLLVMVNYTTLLNGIDRSGFPPLGQARFTTMSFSIGLTGNTDKVLNTADPIALYQGLNLLAGIIANVRQDIDTPTAATLGAGILSATTDFLTAGIGMLVSDPDPLIPTGQDISTLRLFMQTDPSEWNAAVQERSKSVWSGISAIGGFWTFVDGIFAFIFGTSLLFVFFGSKPLGTFGLIHKLKSVPLPEYPRLKDEGTTDPGLLQFIRDHFVELDDDSSDDEKDAHTYPDDKPHPPRSESPVDDPDAVGRRLWQDPHRQHSYSESITETLQGDTPPKLNSRSSTFSNPESLIEHLPLMNRDHRKSSSGDRMSIDYQRGNRSSVSLIETLPLVNRDRRRSDLQRGSVDFQRRLSEV
ncbi:hypothetical protein CYLTODRAFT_492302 [Cylindrobasidium torrendii FP15055 ss-10]|uniref:Uncharacterized protein n=1 Tax=Cylindrobasidium torrendii FP15055 ss-10 TaxID=1314674 RepID=A0A0D7B5K0_9AGAR|nr:hypothetical protein CYLTODRAFT_492302 [Cylindrobasidium torrendii FP15055 ss-10]